MSAHAEAWKDQTGRVRWQPVDSEHHAAWHGEVDVEWKRIGYDANVGKLSPLLYRSKARAIRRARRRERQVARNAWRPVGGRLDGKDGP